MSERDLALVVKRNNMPHIDLLRQIVTRDHRGQHVASVHRAIRVYMKLDANFKNEASLLSVFKIRAHTKRRNRLSPESFEQIVAGS